MEPKTQTLTKKNPMAEIDRVYTVEATGITLTTDSGTFPHNKGTLPQAAAPFLS